MTETRQPYDATATYSAGYLNIGSYHAPIAPAGREYLITIMKPGFVIQADGRPSNWLIPAEVIARDAHMFDGVSCYLDHPDDDMWGYRGEPKVKNLVGVTSDVTWSPDIQALVGRLRLYDQDPSSPGAFVGSIADQMLADRDAGKSIPSVGLSAVFFHASKLDEDTGNRITTAFHKVESVDVVYSPGAGGYIREALSAIRSGATLAPQTTHERNSTMPPANPYEGTPVPEIPAPVPAPPPTPAGPAVPPAPPAPAAPSTEPTLHDVLVTISQIAGQVDQLSDALHQQTQAHGQLQALVAGREEARTIQNMGQPPRADRVSVGPTGLEQIQAAVDWIFGVTNAPPPPPDLRRTDRIYYLLTGDGGWLGRFEERDALAAANATTLAGMAVNAMNKVIVPLYDRLINYRWFEPLVTVQPTDGSLHDMAWIQFGGIANLPIVAEGAAYTELTVDDSKEADAFVKYGGYVGITEKMLRNSDIAKIQAIPRALTIAAVQTRSAKIASIFTAQSGTGPTLDQDSVVLFHTNSHGNLATTAFSFSAWAAARLECYKQTELNSSKRQGLWPKYWLGPADLYDTALDVFGYGAGMGGEPGTGNNDVNPYGVSRPGDPRPIPIAVPDFTDTNDWAYLADPVIAPVIQMAYADNPGGGIHPPPMLYSVTSPLAGLMFTNDVLPIKVRDQFAYGVATYRGIGKRNVT